MARTSAATNGGATADYIISGGFGVSNGDDEIILELPDLTIIDQVNYDGGPLFPDPIGKSLSLDPSKFNATDNDSGANWCEATTAFGTDSATPGVTNDVCPTLSVSTFDDARFNIYPNPTNTGFVNIKTTTNVAVNVTVFDVLGKLVISQTLNNNRLNVSILNSGVYILRLSQNGTATTKKLVIK